MLSRLKKKHKKKTMDFKQLMPIIFAVIIIFAIVKFNQSNPFAVSPK